jgi:hypothetical protein
MRHLHECASDKAILNQSDDVGVRPWYGVQAEGARLESDSGEPHRVIPKHLFTQSIQHLPVAECLLM